MNLKFKRLVRTSSSEQYALFDLDAEDDDGGAPPTVGKLDLHYTTEGVYGTLLLWDGATGKLAKRNRLGESQPGAMTVACCGIPKAACPCDSGNLRFSDTAHLKETARLWRC